MRRTRRTGNFIIVLLFNILINLDGAIPAVILLGLHFWLGLPIWIFWAALGLWLGSMIIYMLVLGFASRCANSPEPYKENKNPYSNRNRNPYSAGGIKAEVKNQLPEKNE